MGRKDIPTDQSVWLEGHSRRVIGPSTTGRGHASKTLRSDRDVTALSGRRKEDTCEGRSRLFPLFDRAFDLAAGFAGFDGFATIVLFLAFRQG